MLLAWKSAGVITYAGYILGFPADTVESIMHDIDVIKRELPVDLLEFFYLTPLPGSEDHLKLFKAGAWLDPDLNKYDLNHICTTHPKMSREEWDRAYRWRGRAITRIDTCRDDLAAGGRDEGERQQRAVPHHLVHGLDQYRAHPSARRRLPAAEIRVATGGRALPIEPVWSFYPKYFVELAGKLVQWARALYEAAPHLSAHQTRSAAL